MCNYHKLENQLTDVDVANSITSQPVGEEKHKGKKEEDGLDSALLSVPPGPQR